MKKIVAELFKRPITKEQSKDTGMAMVLLLLLFSAAFKRETLVTIAIVALVVDMTVPRLYRPVAVLWLGLSHLLGTVVSKILLTLVFFAVVTPIGLARKLLGLDSLKLKDFKSGDNSVMIVRNHIFTGKTSDKWLDLVCRHYLNPIKHYVKAEVKIINVSSSALAADAQGKKEAAAILEKLSDRDLLILLENKGRQFSSEEFAVQLNKLFNSGKSKIGMG